MRLDSKSWRTPSRRFITIIVLAVFLAGTALWFSSNPIRNAVEFTGGKLRGGYSVAERVEQYGQAVETRLHSTFARAGLSYPPKQLTLVAIKDAQQLELYARQSESDVWRFIKAYPVLAASGKLGPKLKSGDYQVPEGVYRIAFLNPNSRFHLSLKLDYPNHFDQKMARSDGRSDLGGDIMIHGNSVSIGCLAMGDEAAEELFVMAALSTKENVTVIISPIDFRTQASPGFALSPPWTAELYASLRKELRSYRRSHSPGEISPRE